MGTDFHFADFWYTSTLLSYFRSLFVIAPWHWSVGAIEVIRSFFQQILSSWYRTFPHSKAENSYDSCRKFFQNKPIEKGCGMGWDEKETHLWKCLLWQNLPLNLSALQLRALHYCYYGCWCLILGSRCTAQTSAPKRFKQHTCLGKVPAHYSRYRSSASTEDRRVVKVIVIAIKGILYPSIRGLTYPDFRQNPVKKFQ